MTRTSLEDAVSGGVALAGDDTGAADQTSSQVINDVAIQIGHDLRWIVIQIGTNVSELTITSN